MSIVVYYVLETKSTPYAPGSFTSSHKCFDSKELTTALGFCQELRNSGFKHVTLSSEMDESVGKPGVDSVVDGKTPDGLDYDWSKADRAGAIKRHERKDYQKPNSQ